MRVRRVKPSWVTEAAAVAFYFGTPRTPFPRSITAVECIIPTESREGRIHRLMMGHGVISPPCLRKSHQNRVTVLINLA